MISLYKAYVLPHIEYCSPLLLGISKSLKNTMERVNHYAIKSLLALEERRIVQSLILFFVF